MSRIFLIAALISIIAQGVPATIFARVTPPPAPPAQATPSPSPPARATSSPSPPTRATPSPAPIPSGRAGDLPLDKGLLDPAKLVRSH
ncbi:MAG TPA: hypothetical protein VGS79_25010 [Puia sp.]|nr:hypothetical protein [Puia sp.]